MSLAADRPRRAGFRTAKETADCDRGSSCRRQQVRTSPAPGAVPV